MNDKVGCLNGVLDRNTPRWRKDVQTLTKQEGRNMEVAIIGMLLIFAIMVAISRWIFRVNDIVNRLDSIIILLKAGMNVEEVKKEKS
jgi:hypothetical protein